MSNPSTPFRTSRVVALLILFVGLSVALAACGDSPASDPRLVTVVAVGEPAGSPTTAPPTSMPLPAVSPPEMPTAAPTPQPPLGPTPTLSYSGVACGQNLPLVSTYDGDLVSALEPDPAALASLEAILPPVARPALAQILADPANVGLAVYRVGEEASGAYLNAAAPMPLASVVKVIHLAAFAEAVAAGRLDALSTVPLSALEAYYQPGLDLGAQNTAISSLAENGRVFGDPPTVLLDEVPRMMIEFSSNAATDYLHMLLGQAVIEQTARDLGLESQTAPCPFVGQFLAMGSPERESPDDQQAIRDYLAYPQRYGEEVMWLTELFSTDAAFRELEHEWRRTTRRPTGQTQRFFSENLSAQATAADYAEVMATFALNGLSSGESSFIARRYLEWPMRFAVNQERFSNLGYKGGSLPGILTTAYYAYPLGETTPVVIALFFRDLPGRTYRTWLGSQTHDELARWLLAEPAAIPALRAVLQPAGGG